MKRPEKLVTIKEYQSPQHQPHSSEAATVAVAATATGFSIPVINITSMTATANTNRHSDNLFIWSHISVGLLSTWLNGGGGGEFADNRKVTHVSHIYFHQ